MLWAGFLFGLVGSLHCVGMCGAIALALPGADGPRLRYVAGRVLYNLGRLTTYALLGAAVGAVGQGLRLAGWQQGLSVLAGGLVVALVAVPERWQARAAAVLGLGVVLGRVKARLGYFYQRPTLGSLYAAGVLNGLLPCGLVYVALAGALSMPGVAGGAAYMALFGLGTQPLMLLVALGGPLLPWHWRSRLRWAVPGLALGLAALFIVRGLGLGIPYLSPRLSATVGAPAAPGRHQPASVTWCHGPAPQP